MRCINYYESLGDIINIPKNELVTRMTEKSIKEKLLSVEGNDLIFGVDSAVSANEILQNNLTEFEWVERNKIAPFFWGRFVNGRNSLSEKEIEFLHNKNTKIALAMEWNYEMNQKHQGYVAADSVVDRLYELHIPSGNTVFLEVNEKEISMDFIIAFAEELLKNGYCAGFKANTDAKYSFDREIGRAISIAADLFSHVKVWATAPQLSEYIRMKTSHIIHPDVWTPFAPSFLTRKEITIWEYGRECHIINDNLNRQTSFNLNLINNRKALDMLF